MRKYILVTAFLLLTSAVGAEEITCKGNIISIQGEGMVARKHRFEVSGVTGYDVNEVLGKSRKIAQERQNRAARKNPAGNFRKMSDLELECTRGSERFEVRRIIKTD